MGVQERHRLAAPPAAPPCRQAMGSPRPMVWVQLTPFDRGGQAGCVRAKGLIKYLTVN